MERAETKKIMLADIAVAERIRKENGSLRELADSIRERGLINPITVMENAEGRYLLIAGLRRLEACRVLGYADIRATVLSPLAADEALMVEIAENEQRKEFTISERLNYAAKIREVEKEKALERMSEGARNMHIQGTPKRAYPESGEARAIVAKKAGFTSHTQMSRAEIVAEKRPDLLDKIDSGETTIFGAFKETQKTEEDSETGDAPFEPDQILEGVPVVSEAELRRRMTREEREEVRRIEEQVVIAKPVEMELLDVFNPASVPVAGDANSIAGAPHDRLLENPVYAALFQKYTEAVQAANAAKGELRTRCESYEKRIRGYEENRLAMERTIERLQSENAALRETQNVGA